MLTRDIFCLTGFTKKLVSQFSLNLSPLFIAIPLAYFSRTDLPEITTALFFKTTG
jgi:hypothetical protein